MDLIPTPSQTVGPFFDFCLTTHGNCTPVIAGPHAKGQHIRLVCGVFDGAGAILDDAMIEIWQADANGKYPHPDDPQEKTLDLAFRGFGRMGTGQDGMCEFETIRPGRVPCPEGLQGPHLNLAVFARGMLKQLYTRVYFAGDPGNTEDPILALVPRERRETLMAHPDAPHPDSAEPDSSKHGVWRFDIHLQGKNETAFFDV